MSQVKTLSYATMAKRGSLVVKPPALELIDPQGVDVEDFLCHCNRRGGWCLCGLDIADIKEATRALRNERKASQK